MKSLAEGFKSGESEFKNSVQEMIADVSRSIDTSKFNSVGVNLAKGLEQGFLSQESTISAHVNAMINRIKSKAEANQEIESPSKVWAEVGSYMAQGLDVGFVNQMKTVTRDITNSLPTGISGVHTSQNTGSGGMVSAFKEALSEVKIELDDEAMGKFVDKTVTNLVFS